MKMVGATGFEPATSASRTQRSSQAELRPDVLTDLANAMTLSVYLILRQTVRRIFSYQNMVCVTIAVHRRLLRANLLNASGFLLVN